MLPGWRGELRKLPVTRKTERHMRPYRIVDDERG